MINPRIEVIHWLVQVVDKGRSVNQLLANSQTESADKPLQSQQKALAKQMLFGCLRYYFQLKTMADNLLAKPFKARDTDLLMVILLGLYQLKYLSTPDHAAISESVELTKKLNKSWASGVVNGVLRHYQRSAKAIELSLQKSIQFQTAHPGWIVKKLTLDWPENVNEILASNNQQAPMVLRNNSLHQSRDTYLLKLENSSLTGKRHPVAPDAIVLDKAADVTKLPGFFDGDVTVQDAAAQLVVEMLDLKSAQCVLDACAAPGGKTTHILQREQTVKLTAVEISASRAEKINQTLERLKLSCHVICADITHVESWWNGQLFDRILLDVPCSASGVIRRNPDIKVHRKITDIQPLVSLQQNILNQCWQLLKPGGILVYATCSAFKVENEEQMQMFSNAHQVEHLLMPTPIHQALNSRAKLGYQILPGEHQMDGFYFCGLKKPIQNIT